MNKQVGNDRVEIWDSKVSYDSECYVSVTIPPHPSPPQSGLDAFFRIHTNLCVSIHALTSLCYNDLFICLFLLLEQRFSALDVSAPQGTFGSVSIFGNHTGGGYCRLGHEGWDAAKHPEIYRQALYHNYPAQNVKASETE